MNKLQQTNQELYEAVTQLAELNRNFKQHLYTLERIIGIQEERIRFLEEELNNTIEASTEEKKEYRDRIELRNTQEALQNAQTWNFGENESDSDENSLDLYNSDDYMGVATLTAVRAIGAGNGGNQIGGLNTAGEFRSKAGAEIAGGESTNNAPVVPNAGRGFPAITIATGIKLWQLFYLFSTSYTMVEHLKQMAVFGQLMQGDMGVEEFFQSNQKAEEEKFTLSQRNAPSSLPAFPAANPYIDTNKSEITKTEISTIKSFQETMSRATKTLDNSKKSSKKRAEDTAINHFLSDLLKKNLVKHSADEYDHDPIEDILDSLAGLTLNSVIKTAVRRAVKKSSDSDSDSGSSTFSNTSSSNSSNTSSSNFSDSSDSEKISLKTPKTSLKETIRKVLQSELKLIFPEHFSQDSIKANIPNQAPLIQEKIESQSNTSLITKVVSLDPDEEEDLDVDSGAEPPIITENIVEHVGTKIDKSEIHDLSGIATVPVESVGVVCKLPITLAPGCTIYEDFIVVKYQKPTLIFSNQLLKKYN
ncbi:hypothetical protein C2G38_2174003 [Gigaspora rosea]|uniref:Uncharacterized protein n=1 Tax=Gigaspora rosea TaxID=44941 RepID=A0A397VIY4_9GLOM|nr:hypothetical protein C2G38_2174003 [Gigaspora rosea]